MEKYKFGDLFDYLPKSKIKAGQGKDKGMYPLFTSSPSLTKYFDKYIYEGESIIFGTGGLPSIHYIDDKFSTSTDCLIVQKKKKYEDKVDSSYVYYFFKGNSKILEAGFHGAGLKHISKKYISNIKIPFPENLDDQIRIANLLSQVESLIAKREESIKLLDELLKSTFLDMFGDPVLNPMGWDVVPLSRLGEINRGISKHRPRNAPELLNGKYPLIQTGDVANADLYIEGFSQTYSDIGLAQSKLWAKDTLCITIAANIAKTAILKFEACFPDSVVGMKIDKYETNLFYIHFLFKFFQKLLEKNAPQAAQKNINLQILRTLKVPKPPKTLQDKFATIVQQVEQTKQQHQKSLKELKNLFGSLSQRAFRGELDLSKMKLETSDTQDEWTAKMFAKQEAYEKAIEKKVYESGLQYTETVSIKKIPLENLETYIIDLIKLEEFDLDDMAHHFDIDFSYDEFKKKFYKLLDEEKIIQEFDTQQKKMKFEIKP